MTLAMLAAVTMPYETTSDGYIRGFSHDAQYEYELHVATSPAQTPYDALIVKRTNCSWSQPIAHFAGGAWRIAPDDEAAARLVRSVERAIAFDVRQNVVQPGCMFSIPVLP